MLGTALFSGDKTRGNAPGAGEGNPLSVGILYSPGWALLPTSLEAVLTTHKTLTHTPIHVEFFFLLLCDLGSRHLIF